MTIPTQFDIDTLKEDAKISKAFDEHKNALIKRRHDLTVQALKISIEFLEVERDLLEYEEEY